MELGEIEAALNRHEAVAESCVLLWGETSEEKRLAAYVVVKEETSERQLRDYLQQHLLLTLCRRLLLSCKSCRLLPTAK